MDTQPENTPDANAPITPSSSPSAPQPANNKKLLYGVLAALTVLVVLLIVLVFVLIGKKDADTNTSTNTGPSNSSQSNNTQTNPSTPSKKIILTVPTKDEKLEYVIYEPKQTSTGTTIDFGVRNKCNECEDRSYTASVISAFSSATSSYLLDEAAGQKYSPVKDADGDVLSTPSCSTYLEPGETQDCFVTFAKVPSGTTVSWVFGSVRIDGIKVE